MVHDGHCWHRGNVLAPGVNQMLVLLPFRSQRAVADDPVFRVEDDLFAGVDVVGAQSGHAHAQIHDPLALKFHRQAVAHGLALKSGFIGHL